MKYQFNGRIPTEIKIAALHKVWNAGMTALQMSVALTSLTKETVTKSTLIGFYDRNRHLRKKYPLHNPSPVKKAPPPKVAKDKVVKLKPKPTDPKPDADKPEATADGYRPREQPKVNSKNKRLAELEANECHWPTGADADNVHLFCGHPIMLDGQHPYCKAHHDFGRNPDSHMSKKQMQLIAKLK